MDNAKQFPPDASYAMQARWAGGISATGPFLHHVLVAAAIQRSKSATE